mgnify:CR=1 FL=1
MDFESFSIFKIRLGDVILWLKQNINTSQGTKG